jgi:hypothetical protein
MIYGGQMRETETRQFRQKAFRLIAERQRLEQILTQHQYLLRGSLLERPKFCGKPGCKCTRGQPHPPSLYLSRLVEGTVRHLFIRATDHERAKRGAIAYKEFRQALRRWRVIDKDLNRIWEALGETREESYPFE